MMKNKRLIILIVILIISLSVLLYLIFIPYIAGSQEKLDFYLCGGDFQEPRFLSPNCYGQIYKNVDSKLICIFLRGEWRTVLEGVAGSESSFCIAK